ncbi:hypothetical protein OE88DRAFT_1649780 [Heliocybe sulcata]|uniref:Uncharacterized protein n=1 Tax=Heliocybe sulcata TaxID=5364 RepID=A0A5C3NJ27_9AGAM|nr:hypothetical protein OE88DRAFT_1649780 [Heliocybe sulcata]
MPSSSRTARPIRRGLIASRSPSPSPSTSSTSSSSGPSSPPDPPIGNTDIESLEDQLYAAYANEDEALTRRLCLELKTTPDAFFAPPGLLALEEPEATRVRECQAREAQWRAQRRREEKLRDNERVWEESREALRAQKAEREQRERWRACHVPRGHSNEYLDSLVHQSPSRSELHHSPRSRPLSSYAPRAEPQFQYTMPILPPSRSPRARQVAIKADSRCIPYKTVLKTINGSLFPMDESERRTLESVSSSPKSRLLLPNGTSVSDAHAQSRGRKGGSGMSESKLIKRVNAFLDIAKGIQRAYASAVMFSVPGAHYDDEMVRDLVRKTRKSEEGEAGKVRLLPQGYRAKVRDVSVFTAPSPPSPCTTGTNTALLTPYALIPLQHPLPSPNNPDKDPAAHPLWRLRPISNPVLLRLKALQNTCMAQRLGWEGRAREGALGCGRERLVGIAWERRRSGLSVEVRWVEGEGGL